MPKKKPSVKVSFERWMNAIEEDERKNFQLVGKDIVCRVCSKKFSSWSQKFLLTQHLRTALHKRSVQLKLNPTAERQEEKSHPFFRWIKDVDDDEKRNFQLDGKCIICNVCFKRFEWDQKCQLTQHLETTKHKKSVQLKNAAVAAVKPDMIVIDKKESPESNLCVFCATGIRETNNISVDDGVVEDNGIAPARLRGDVNGIILKEEAFLKGMHVICKKLQVDSKFATRKKWSGAGDDGGADIVKNVCCKKCHEDLAKLVALREQINELQVLMKQLVTELERLVVWSQETSIAGGGDKSEFNFKSKTCLKFRQQILKNHQNSEDAKIFHQPTAFPVAASTNPEIKVEQFNDVLFSSKIDQEDIRDREDFNFEGDYNLHDDDITSSPIYETEQECQPVEPRRKRKKTNVGVPLNNKVSEGRQRKLGCPPVRNIDDEPVLKPDKRKTKRYRKFKIITEESSSDEKEDQDDEYIPDNFESENESDNDDKKKDANAKTASSCNSTSSGIPKLEKAKKIPGRILKGDGPSFRTIYVLNSDNGSLMFLNVKFQMTQDSLLCQHPHCSHEVPVVGYFTDQTAFLIMRFHIQKFHRRDRNQFKPVTYNDSYHFCCHCEMQLESRLELIKHQQEHHKDFVMSPAICEICGKTMSDDELSEHLISHKSVEEKQMADQVPRRRGKRVYSVLLPRQFPCDQCDRVYPNSTELRLHRERHDPWEKRKAIICNYCGGRFVSENTMEYHIRRVHFKEDEPTPFECGICGMKFMRCHRYRYKEHVRSHAGDKPFQCEQCGKKFTTKSNLTDHKKTHVHAQLPCEFCGQIYKGKKYLRRHHFKHHSELVKRVRKYGQKKEDFIGPKLMYPCEPCGHVFVYKSVLVAHLKRLHKMELEKNEDYPTMFTWEDSVDIK